MCGRHPSRVDARPGCGEDHGGPTTLETSLSIPSVRCARDLLSCSLRRIAVCNPMVKARVFLPPLLVSNDGVRIGEYEHPATTSTMYYVGGGWGGGQARPRSFKARAVTSPEGDSESSPLIVFPGARREIGPLPAIATRQRRAGGCCGWTTRKPGSAPFLGVMSRSADCAMGDTIHRLF